MTLRNQRTNLQDVPFQIQHLYQSDFYQIKHWAFDWTGIAPPPDGYNDSFCFVFVHEGRLAIDLATQPYDLHTGHVIVEKANYVYRLRPATGACSIINFTADFYQQLVDECGLRHSFFFGNPNLLTLGMRTTPALDYLHHQLWHTEAPKNRLERDQLVLNLVQEIIGRMENHDRNDPLSPAYKRFHLTTIEQAKAYMNREFNRDLSLMDLATHCCVSPFHLGRIFKATTGYTPYQYLLSLRLAHAGRLLRDTGLPVMDIGFASGFNSLEHFATAFRHQYRVSPSQYRQQVN